MVVLDDVSGVDAVDANLPNDAQSVSNDACGQSSKQLTFVPQPAMIVILLDRSLDMQFPFDGTTRQLAAQNALVSEIEAFQGKIKFGFEQFPVDPAVSPCAQGSCCADKVIAPALSNYSVMKTNISCSDPRNSSCSVRIPDSPSNAALAKVRDYYKSLTTNDDLYVLLVTSSEPSCAGDQCFDALSAAADLGNERIRIFVLSVAYQPEPWSCLSQIARKGASPHASNSLYTANNVSDLRDALSQVFSAVAQSACTLNSSSVPPSNAKLTVSIGTAPVSPAAWDGRDGWSANSNNTIITLSGSACDNYLSLQEKLNVGYTVPDACNPGWP
jgi:hypothetical protein